MILVTGATGTTGGAVLDELLATGAAVRALTRSAERAEALRARGAEAVVGDLGDPTSLIPAFRGVERFFLVSPRGEHQVELETNAIAVGEQAGAYAVVKVGGIGQGHFSPLPSGRAHAEIFDAIQATSLRWTLLQPNGYMQSFLAAVGDGRLVSSRGDARVAHVDARDVGAVAARALGEAGHEASSYRLTGPEALSDREVAELLGVDYEQTAEEDPEDVARSGVAGGVTVDAEAVLGRPPRSFAQFAAEHRAASP